MSRFIRFYIDIPSAVVVLALAVIFREYVIEGLIVPVSDLLSIDISAPTVGASLLIGTISSVLGVILLALLAWLIFHSAMRNALSGKFSAYTVKDPTDSTKRKEESWGEATILFHPFALNRNGVKVKLRLKHGNIILEGLGLIVDNRFLIGHYTEIGKVKRRRSGSFFYTLDGTGNNWEGQYQYIDPVKSSPCLGHGIWKRDKA